MIDPGLRQEIVLLAWCRSAMAMVIEIVREAKVYMSVNNFAAPVIGNISMDQTTVDITDVPNVKAGDMVSVLDNSNDLTSIEHIADSYQCSVYEVCTGITDRVQRIYLDK